MIGQSNFKSSNKSRKILVKSNTERISHRNSSSYHSSSFKPVVLFKFMIWVGLLAESDQNSLYRISSLAFKVLLISINLSLWISSLTAFSGDWKTLSAYLTSFLLTTGVYFAIYCRRQALMVVLKKLSKISKSSDEKTVNFITILILCLPAIYSILQAIVFDDNPWFSRFETYGYDIENHTLKILYISTKFFLYALVHPAFTCLVTLLQCVLCQRFCALINDLTQKVMQVSSEDFDSSKQTDILRLKAKIDEIFENLQYVFSVPSFLVTAINFLTCGAMIGWLLYVDDLSILPPFAIVEIAFYIVIDFSSLIALLWVTGNVPVELKKLKCEFYKKIRSRILYFSHGGETQLRKELFGHSNFTFSGCDIISFKRSTILALSGTLVTYTFLVITVKK
ncbi:uncharacterized protein TNCT_165111 [Trichonephila clavata]|uniref:Gustatory receptor n=1 Tax=Trichonephila clavata TaxID=2740835 RepID=A0A8X6J4N6_TRICU|nr:uncharacterized protein TNCT_165111 [Trichonephila clavata]